MPKTLSEFSHHNLLFEPAPGPLPTCSIGRYIGGLPNKSDRTYLLSLLFDPKKGLGLTRVRYMMSPSLNWRYSLPVVWWGDHDYSAYTPEPGVYNWTADWKHVVALQEGKKVAEAAGNKLHVDAISLSPPWYLSVSRDVSGGVNGTQNIQGSANMTEYAKFLVLLAQHFKSDFGIQFETLTAMNEPLEGWWTANKSVIGCSFTFDGAKQMYAAVEKQKKALGADWLELAGVDSWPRHTTVLLNETYKGETTPFKVVTAHGYLDKLNMTMREMETHLTDLRQAASSRGLRVWQTEWGPMWVPGSDLETALFMGRSIAEQVNIMGASSWFHFLAIHRLNGVQWGTVMVNISAGAPVRPVFNKQFYGTMHYSRLIPEGSTILKVPTQCYHGVIAAYSPDKNQITVTAANQENYALHLLLHFNGFRRKSVKEPVIFTTYVTSSTMDFEVIDTSQRHVMKEAVDFRARKQSITSVVISNMEKAKRRKVRS